MGKRSLCLDQKWPHYSLQDTPNWHWHTGLVYIAMRRSNPDMNTDFNKETDWAWQQIQRREKRLFVATETVNMSKSSTMTRTISDHKKITIWMTSGHQAWFGAFFHLYETMLNRKLYPSSNTMNLAGVICEKYLWKIHMFCDMILCCVCSL